MCRETEDDTSYSCRCQKGAQLSTYSGKAESQKESYGDESVVEYLRLYLNVGGRFLARAHYEVVLGFFGDEVCKVEEADREGDVSNAGGSYLVVHHAYHVERPYHASEHEHAEHYISGVLVDYPGESGFL
uniref:hypothetical protein n=1 Tax=Thermococcus onnurineus TaxID=342948 RepID=UPI00373AEB77